MALFKKDKQDTRPEASWETPAAQPAPEPVKETPMETKKTENKIHIADPLRAMRRALSELDRFRERLIDALAYVESCTTNNMPVDAKHETLYLLRRSSTEFDREAKRVRAVGR